MGAKTRVARYAASEQIASFDFYPWLVLMKAKGATEIVIDRAQPKTSKFSPAEVLQRFDSIVLPGPALAGLPMRIGNDQPQISGSTKEFFTWARERPIERLRSVKPAAKSKYTVTLRRSHRVPGRNSDEPAWRQFGEDIGATIIDDYYVRPMHLHDRLALYAGAEMNFIVNSGIGILLSLTEYPTTIFVTNASRHGLFKIGIPPETNFPWMLQNQCMVWKDDTLTNLRETFAQLQ